MNYKGWSIEKQKVRLIGVTTRRVRIGWQWVAKRGDEKLLAPTLKRLKFEINESLTP